MTSTLFFVKRTILVALASFTAFVSASSAASAEEDATMPELSDLPILPAQESAKPPPSNIKYLQYGPALIAELIGPLSSPGPMCSGAVRSDGQKESTCILGSGGGVVLRGGIRAAGPWYFGAAYSLSKQDSNKLMRLPLLQQLRGEARYYIRPDFQTQPFGSFGLGVAAYGNEFGFSDTLGPQAFVGGGAETQLSQRYVLIVALAYRAMLFNKFTDSSGALRPSGVATALGLEFGLESRDLF